MAAGYGDTCLSKHSRKSLAKVGEARVHLHNYAARRGSVRPEATIPRIRGTEFSTPSHTKEGICSPSQELPSSPVNLCVRLYVIKARPPSLTRFAPVGMRKRGGGCRWSQGRGEKFSRSPCVCVCTRVWPKNGREMERIGRIKDCVKTRFAKVDPHAGCRKLEYGGQLRA